MWVVTETRQVSKDLAKFPKRIRLVYQALTEDLKREGPHPYGWESLQLKNRAEVRIKLNREYRVLLLVVAPQLIVVKVAHRKEAYE